MKLLDGFLWTSKVIEKHPYECLYNWGNLEVLSAPINWASIVDSQVIIETTLRLKNSLTVVGWKL